MIAIYYLLIFFLLLGIAVAVIPTRKPASASPGASRVLRWLFRPLVDGQPYFLWRHWEPSRFPKDWRRVVVSLLGYAVLFSTAFIWMPPLAAILSGRQGDFFQPLLLIPSAIGVLFFVHAVRVWIFARTHRID